MRVKFNKFERVAGVFVLGAIIGSIAITLGVAAQKGWFSSKVSYSAILDSAEGIHSGTVVQVAGLRAGSVREVELLSANEVLVKIELLEKFSSRIREDSKLQVVRPFIIGEKVFDISIGSEESPKLKSNSHITVTKSFDVMDLVSGRKLGPILGSLQDLAKNMQTLAEAFADEKRTASLIKMFDQLTPLVTNMNTMAERVVGITDVVNKKKRLETMVDSLVSITGELNKVVPQFTQNSPNLGKDLSSLVTNVSELLVEFKKLTPAINAIAPELPGASKRALEALDETVVTLKAIQKSFLLSGKVEDVRKEELEKKSRQPASQDNN